MSNINSRAALLGIISASAIGSMNRPFPVIKYAKEPINTGRRKEKDYIAMEKAERKRQRRATKRLAAIQETA